MAADGRLHSGQQLNLELARGAEVFCAAGRVQVAALQPWPLSGTSQLLSTGQGWRAAEATRVSLLALQPTHYRVVPGVSKKKPRDAGLVITVQRLLRGLMRARRAA